MRHSNYRPPDALRWLALTSGAEACEVLEYAEKALKKSSRAPREVLEKAIGVGRREEVVKSVNNLGQVWMKSIQTPKCLNFENGLSNSEAIKARLAAVCLHIPIDQEYIMQLYDELPCTTREFSDSARACFALAEKISGEFSAPSVNLGILDYCNNKFDAALVKSTLVASSGKSNRIKQLAHALRVTIILESGLFVEALENCCLSLYDIDRDIAASHVITKIAIAANLNCPHLIEELIDLGRDFIYATEFEGTMRESATRLIVNLSGDIKYREVVSILEKIKSSRVYELR
ncbi:MAG: hypothetical protein HY286_17640 [Planctomycetes bacterium]|nr:hypothetical protein [Planctomycetota bacterium]